MKCIYTHHWWDNLVENIVSPYMEDCVTEIIYVNWAIFKQFKTQAMVIIIEVNTDWITAMYSKYQIQIEITGMCHMTSHMTRINCCNLLPLTPSCNKLFFVFGKYYIKLLPISIHVYCWHCIIESQRLVGLNIWCVHLGLILKQQSQWHETCVSY